METRTWVKVPLSILDDPKWGLLPDDEWCAKFREILTNPENIHFENNRDEYIAHQPEIRKAVFERDPHECNYCGSTENLEVDHIIPLSRGGTNDMDNLQILCRSCNRSKGAR